MVTRGGSWTRRRVTRPVRGVSVDGSSAASSRCRALAASPFDDTARARSRAARSRSAGLVTDVTALRGDPELASVVVMARLSLPDAHAGRAAAMQAARATTTSPQVAASRGTAGVRRLRGGPGAHLPRSGIGSARRQLRIELISGLRMRRSAGRARRSRARARSGSSSTRGAPAPWLRRSARPRPY